MREEASARAAIGSAFARADAVAALWLLWCCATTSDTARAVGEMSMPEGVTITPPTAPARAAGGSAV
jgi:hypothetical protein